MEVEHSIGVGVLQYILLYVDIVVDDSPVFVHSVGMMTDVDPIVDIL